MRIERIAIVLGAIVVASACATGAARPAEAQGARAAPAMTALREGLIIDQQAGVAYVMRGAGGVAAVDLATGATRWSSTEADVPLALVGRTLVAQVAPRTAAAPLEIASLDVQAGGRRIARGTLQLAPNVKATLGESLHGTFTIAAEPAGTDVLLRWTFFPSPVRGGMETTDSAAVAARRPSSGVLQLRPSTGALTRLERAAAAVPPRGRRWIVANAEKVRDAAPTQYESADGRHILASQVMGDDRVWDKYRWTVYEKLRSRRVGEVRTHVSFAPFVVRDSIIVFETTPYQRAGQPMEPAKLRGVSLTTGREVWSVAVLELVYRGPLPP